MSKTLKLAFVGCGAIAPYHLNGIKEHAPRIQVTAAIDPNRAKSEEISGRDGRPGLRLAGGGAGRTATSMPWTC